LRIKEVAEGNLGEAFYSLLSDRAKRGKATKLPQSWAVTLFSSLCCASLTYKPHLTFFAGFFMDKKVYTTQNNEYH